MVILREAASVIVPLCSVRSGVIYDLCKVHVVPYACMHICDVYKVGSPSIHATFEQHARWHIKNFNCWFCSEFGVSHLIAWPPSCDFALVTCLLDCASPVVNSHSVMLGHILAVIDPVWYHQWYHQWCPELLRAKIDLMSICFRSSCKATTGL